MKIPITKTCLDKKEEKAVLSVLRSGWLAQGKRVKDFEEVTANYLGANYVTATSSCTTALHLSLFALGIGKGDEVIVPSYTFIATANAVLYCGAIPIFADIDQNTYNIDPLSIEKKITKRTRAIIPVHQVGLSSPMDEVLRIAKRHNLKVIEDAACALGSEYKGRRIGSLNSEAACFSFHPRKVITTGEGGIIATKDKSVWHKTQMLRSHGANFSAFDRHKSGRMSLETYPVLGFNYRMTDIQAAIGIIQLRKLGVIIKGRIALAKKYNQAFKEHPMISIPYIPDQSKHIYQSYIIRINNCSPLSRDKIMQMLQEKGISTRPGIMTIHTQPYYRKRFGKISLPVTEKVSKQSLILPLYPGMRNSEVGYVIDSLIEILKTRN